MIIVTGQLLTSILAAYAFAFLEFPFKRIIFVLFLTTMMIPGEVVFFTNLDTVSSLGDVPGIGKYIGFNTYGALALPFLAIGFGAFLLRQAFLRSRATSATRPRSTATATCGSSHGSRCRCRGPRSRRSRCSPSSRRGTSTCGRSSSPTRATGRSRSGSSSCAASSLDQINTTFAGTVLAAIPLFILLLVFQKQLVRGLTAGAVKG